MYSYSEEYAICHLVPSDAIPIRPFLNTDRPLKPVSMDIGFLTTCNCFHFCFLLMIDSHCIPTVVETILRHILITV